MLVRRLLRALRRWYWWVVPALLGLGLMAFVVLDTVPTYQCETAVFFTQVFRYTPADLANGSTALQQQLPSFAYLATTNTVLQPVIGRLQLDESPTDLAGEVTASAETDSVIVHIQVTDSQPQRGADIANAVAAQLSTAVGLVSPKDASGASTVTGAVVQPAVPASSPTSPRRALDLSLGFGIGLLIGLAAALGRELLDVRVRSADDMAKVPVFSVIGTEADSAAVILTADDTSPRAEVFRRLRTNLQYAAVDSPPRTLVVSSALAGEGKTSIAINLGLVLAAADRKVLLIDADLRSRGLSRTLAVGDRAGLSSVLAGHARLERVLLPSGRPGLTVLPSGPAVPNPSELLGGQELVTILARVQEQFDIILIDSPGLLAVTDAAVLTTRADGVLLVAAWGRPTRAEFEQTVQALSAIDGRVLGAVINLTPRGAASLV